MESRSSALPTASAASQQRSWKAVHQQLVSAPGPLAVADLWRLAIASYLIGHEDDFVQAAQRTHQAQLENGDPRGAARSAFWLGYHLVNRGETAQATGWFGRASRLLEDQPLDCAERGYLLLPQAHRQLVAGDAAAAIRVAEDAVAIGQRSADRDLLALALLLQGRALIRSARVDTGLALLDEAMVAVTTGELSPQVTGLIYCSVIGACREVGAVRRVREWTAALTQWCEQQPDMVAYGGECRVYHADVLLLRGEWQLALEEAQRAAQYLMAGPHPPTAGFALYQQAEVHRLRGELGAAEDAYRAAARLGREPLPGLALLRLAQGDHDAAAASLRRALAEASGALQRARLLPAYIDVLLETNEVDEAQRACDELAGVGKACAGGFLATAAGRARGALALARGDAAAALPLLRSACSEWVALHAPYEAARTRMLIGLACAELGDFDGASLDLEAARSEFRRLGAVTDAGRIPDVNAGTGRQHHHLTRRELEVLALIATGRTNRAIGEALYISEKTVARHVANIFGKLDIASRAAATAYAYQHGLTDRSA